METDARQQWRAFLHLRGPDKLMTVRRERAERHLPADTSLEAARSVEPAAARASRLRDARIVQGACTEAEAQGDPIGICH